MSRPLRPTQVIAARESIGAAVRSARLGQKLTQEQLAVRAGLTRPVINEIENAATNYRVDSLARVCAALGIPLLK